MALSVCIAKALLLLALGARAMRLQEAQNASSVSLQAFAPQAKGGAWEKIVHFGESGCTCIMVPTGADYPQCSLCVFARLETQEGGATCGAPQRALVTGLIVNGTDVPQEIEVATKGPQTVSFRIGDSSDLTMAEFTQQVPQGMVKIDQSPASSTGAHT